MEKIEYEIDGAKITITPENIARCFRGTAAPSETDVLNFVEQCKTKKLNPFAGEIWIIKNDPTQPALIMISKDGAINLANRDPEFRSYKSGIIIFHPEKDEDEKRFEKRIGTFHLPDEYIAGGWCTVEREGETVENTVAFCEFNTGSGFWYFKPGIMIEKVAVVNTLRKAFPLSFSGVYGEGETDKKEETTENQVSFESVSKENEEVSVSKKNTLKKEKLKFTEIETQDQDDETQDDKANNKEVEEKPQSMSVNAADPVEKPGPLPEAPVQVKRPSKKAKEPEVVTAAKVTTADTEDTAKTEGEEEKLPTTLEEALKVNCIPGKTFSWMVDYGGKGYNELALNNFKAKLKKIFDDATDRKKSEAARIFVEAVKNGEVTLKVNFECENNPFADLKEKE